MQYTTNNERSVPVVPIYATTNSYDELRVSIVGFMRDLKRPRSDLPAKTMTDAVPNTAFHHPILTTIFSTPEYSTVAIAVLGIRDISIGYRCS